MQNWIIARVGETFLEALELFVCVTFFDMIGQRDVVKRVLPKGFVVAFHVVVNSFLVAQMEVVLLVVARS